MRYLHYAEQTATCIFINENSCKYGYYDYSSNFMYYDNYYIYERIG
jgi:hypothetical protein